MMDHPPRALWPLTDITSRVYHIRYSLLLETANGRPKERATSKLLLAVARAWGVGGNERKEKTASIMAATGPVKTLGALLQNPSPSPRKRLPQAQACGTLASDKKTCPCDMNCKLQPGLPSFLTWLAARFLLPSRGDRGG